MNLSLTKFLIIQTTDVRLCLDPKRISFIRLNPKRRFVVRLEPTIRTSLQRCLLILLTIHKLDYCWLLLSHFIRLEVSPQLHFTKFQCRVVLCAGTIVNRTLHNNFSGLFYGIPFTKPNPEFVQLVKSQFSPDSKLLLVCQGGLRYNCKLLLVSHLQL